MESKIYLICVAVLLSSWAFVGFVNCDGGGGGDDLPCMQKLLPCQPYLRSPSPPASCCVPLKAMVADDTDCLCAIFNNPEILKNLNITQEEALKLPKACGANADISVCNKATPPGATPSPPVTPSNGPTGGNSTKSSASEIARFGGYGFIAISMSVFISALF